MLIRDICRILSFYLVALAAIMLIPCSLAAYYEYIDGASHPQPHSTWAFLETIFITLTAAFLCAWIGRKALGRLYRREGIALVVMIWIITPAFSSLPFLLSDTLDNPFQAYFEAVSGFTTTGSSVFHSKNYDENGKEIPYVKYFGGVNNITYTFYGTITPVKDPQTGAVIATGVEAVGKAILFWRSMTQWLGGVGIVVLFVAILPLLGVGGKLLFESEVPGPVKEAMTPRVKETAVVLWKIYLWLTALQIILLMITNEEMPLYDAITITFSTISTGGFSVKNLNIAAYHSFSTELVVTIFMVAGSVNFALYYYASKGKFYRFYNPEVFLFFSIIFLAGFLSTFYLWDQPRTALTSIIEGTYNFKQAMRYAFFQNISAMTSTGFVTADYNMWPFQAQSLMLILMYIGGMAGSTAGGIKVIRHYMLFRIGQYKVESIFKPAVVRHFEIGDREVDTSAGIMVLCFFLFCIGISVFGVFFFILNGIDPESALGLVACFINNIGIAFRIAGPTESFAFLSDFGIVLASFLMIMGRLEFFALLAVLVPSFWRQNS